MAAHWLECDDEYCGYSHRFTHVDADSDGVCEDCFHSITEVFDVYIGGKGLRDGDYIDTDGNITDTKPVEGGYAHYEDGVLTLSDYKYFGEGGFTKLYSASSEVSYNAAIYITNEITIHTVGESYIESRSDDDMIICDGVMSETDLVIEGDGALYIFADNDGINMDHGNLTVESGSLFLGWIEIEKFDELVYIEVIGDDAIDLAIGDLTINGGKIFTNSGDHGFDVGGSVEVSGGVIYIFADDDGFNVEFDIKISGGNITVLAEDHAFDSDVGKIEISGGVISLLSENESAITSKHDVIVSGGDIAVFASYGLGIKSYLGNFEMSGGKLRVSANCYAGIQATEILISGGDINVSAIEVPLSAENYNLSGGTFWFDVSDYIEDVDEVSFDSDSYSWSVGLDGDLGTGAVIAIVAASLVVVGVGSFAIAWFVVKKKKSV